MKVSQKQMVRNYLIENGSITSKQAIELFGATRLADIIWKLKKDGMGITSKLIPVSNRFGDVVYVSQYSIGD